MENAYVTRANQEMHPIAKRALELYFNDGRKGFGFAGLCELRQLIYDVSLGDPDELGWMAVSILRFGAHLHLKAGDAAAAADLLIAFSVALPAIKAHNEPLLELFYDAVGREKIAAFQTLTGTTPASSAPCYGELPADGVSLEQLRPRAIFK